jgi:hypothetical protein
VVAVSLVAQYRGTLTAKRFISYLANVCTHLWFKICLNLHFVCNLRATMETQEHLGYDPDYVIGEFGDKRLKKRERNCYSAWFRSNASVCGD